MKKILLAMMMIPLVANASKWVLISNTADGGNISIDAESIRRSGDSVTYWTKSNYASRTESGVLSTKANKTINCRTGELIYRYYIFYDDLNNNGKMLQSFPESSSAKWEPIPPDTINELQMKYVCRK
jgi:hypothetical protein